MTSHSLITVLQDQEKKQVLYKLHIDLQKYITAKGGYSTF